MRLTGLIQSLLQQTSIKESWILVLSNKKKKKKVSKITKASSAFYRGYLKVLLADQVASEEKREFTDGGNMMEYSKGTQRKEKQYLW